MITGVDYQKHIPAAMRKNRFRVVYGTTSSLVEGDEVYLIRDRGDKWLIGHTFHKSLDFDPETLECHSIVDGRLLAKVERIK